MKILVFGKKGRLQKYTPDPSVYEGYEIAYVSPGDPVEDAIAVGKDADFILADAMAKVPAELIEQMPNLKLIHSEGVGFQGFDIEAARKRHIYVCNCKGMNAVAVAEQAILLMLGLLRDIRGGDRKLREGKQIQTKESYMLAGNLRELGDGSIGLVGFGDIAKAAAQMANVFGAKVYYYDVFRAKPEVEEAYQATYLPLDELLAVSDFVSLHLPVTKDTTGMANADFFAKMKQGAYLINTARGELVDDEALIAALRSGKLAGAGLDTISNEPVQPDHPLLAAGPEVNEKILFSCHIGGITGSSFRRGYEMVWSDIKKVEAGEKPDHVVNPW